MKEMYQQAVAGSDRVTKINAAEEIQHSTHTRSIKERFERGEPIAATDDEIDSGKPKPEKADEEVIAAGTRTRIVGNNQITVGPAAQSETSETVFRECYNFTTTKCSILRKYIYIYI